MIGVNCDKGYGGKSFKTLHFFSLIDFIQPIEFRRCKESISTKGGAYAPSEVGYVIVGDVNFVIYHLHPQHTPENPLILDKNKAKRAMSER